MRFNLDTIDNTRYISIPTELFTNPKYAILDIMSKTIYGVLKSRMNLSRINNWVEENGDIFFYMPINELAELLKTSKGTISRKLASLEGAGLLEREHLSSSRCHRMYLHQIESDTCSHQSAKTNAYSYHHDYLETEHLDPASSLSCTNKTQSNVANNATNAEVAPMEPEVAPAKPRVSSVQPIYKKEIQEKNNISVNNNNMYTTNTYNVDVENFLEEKEDYSNPVLNFLQNIGMTTRTITDICRRYSTERIQEVIRILKSQSGIRNSAGFIIAALRFNYQLPAAHLDAPAKETSCQYVRVTRPEPNFESPEFIAGMKNTIEQLFKRRGSILKPYQNWLDAHELTMKDGKVVTIA